MVIAIAGACLAVDRPTASVRLALGSVGPTIIRAPEAEAFAAGAVDWDAGCGRPTPTLAEFGELAAAAARPIDDHRSTAAYRRHAVEVLAAPAAAPGVPARSSDERAVHVCTSTATTHDVRRRLARREPAVRAARAARPDGAKGACEQGECGSCSVLVDGELVCSCLVLAASAVDQPIVTVEGLAEPRRADRRAAGVRRRRRGAVRVLHAGADRWPPTPCSTASPQPTDDRDPRGAVGQHLPLHRLRPDHRRRAAGRRRTRRATPMSARLESASRRVGAGGRIGDSPRAARRHRQGAGHRSRSPSRPAARRCGCGARRCARRTRTPGSCRIDVGPAWRIAGVARGHHRRRRARPAHLRADHQRPAGVRRPTSCATSASRSPPSPPTTPRPAGGRWPRSSSSTRCSSRCSTPRWRSPARTRRSIPTATSCATSASCCGDVDATGDVVVEGTYEIGHAGPGVPRPRGGARHARRRRRRRRAAHRHAVAARGPQADRRLPRPARGEGAARARRRRRRVRRPRGHQPAGAHLPARAARSDGRCACRTAGPRASSATCTATRRRSGCATTPPPTARSSRSRPASCSTAAPTRRRRRPCCSTRSPTPRARTGARTRVVDGYAVRTNHLPCGAMRGFGVVQACFAHEGQMDRLAEACGLDPVEIRLRNAMDDRRPADHRAGGRERRPGRPLHPRDRRAAAARRADRRPPTRRRHRPDAPARRRRAAPPTPATSAAASAGAWRSRT